MSNKKPEKNDARLPQAMVTGTVVYSIAGEQVTGEFTVPAAPVRVRDLLPAFRQVAEEVVRVGVGKVVIGGATISCKSGCGACCRQLVPIAPAETYRIRSMLDRLPPSRRKTYLQRFAAAREKLKSVGLYEKLLQPEQIQEGNVRKLGLEYFALGIACPFLEEESCSIYDERPIACREYLVTSPAEHCAKPETETVEVVPIGVRISNHVARLSGKEGGTRWVPLISALEWAQKNPEPKPDQTGPEVMEQFFGTLKSS